MFSTHVIDNFKDSTATGKGLRIAGAAVAAGAQITFGKDAARGTKINLETGEPDPSPSRSARARRF